MTLLDARVWSSACRLTDVPAGQGAAVLIAGQQIAVFRTDDGSIYALGNRDPFTGANVMARGILGSRGDVQIVTSPMLKHSFSLETGKAVDDPDASLPTFATRVVDGLIQVSVSP